MFQIIPAIDTIGGKCVRLSQGLYTQEKIYDTSPLDMSLRVQSCGGRWLHLVDLDGAKAKKVVNRDTIEEICSETSLFVEFGGGVRSAEDVARLLQLGVSRLSIGSLAITDPPSFSTLLETFGPEHFSLSVDCKDGYVCFHGWEETSSISLVSFLTSWSQKGISVFVVTDIPRDGTLQGIDPVFYQDIVLQFPAAAIIASGGVAGIADCTAAQRAGCAGIIIGKALYEGKIQMEELFCAS